MSRFVAVTSLVSRTLAVALMAAIGLAGAVAHGQILQQQVGGISIDARGVVSKIKVDDLNKLKRERESSLHEVPADLKGLALRKISLRQLEAAIADCRTKGLELTEEMLFLAGLQRIQYVFVYPQLNDIVIAGPGEGWKMDAQGEMVGVTTNQPVMLLDDLLVSLRAIAAAEGTGITCSIDPTAEGLARVQTLLKRVGVVNDPEPVMAAMEEAMGPQTITVRGVPETSHFARVLVAADYRMKRIAMGFDESPVRGLPSFMDMVKAGGGRFRPMLPRWWLEADYDSLLTDEEGLAWELQGSGVKALTEEEVVNASGQRQRAATVNPLAKRWSDLMTKHYEELSKHDAVFGQLRNCMDLAVVAALISKHNLTDKCGWSMPLLLNSDLPAELYNAAHETNTMASVVQKGEAWIVSASGGVQLNPFGPLQKQATQPALGTHRAKAAARNNNWWWN